MPGQICLESLEIENNFCLLQDPEKHKICLYEIGDYKGRKMEIINDDVPSLYSYGFTDRVGSIMVSCGM